MALNIGKEIAALNRMTVTELRRKHIEVFGEPTGSGHKQYLIKRIACGSSFWKNRTSRSPSTTDQADACLVSCVNSMQQAGHDSSAL